MRIYNADGTFVENQKDTEFGWNLEYAEEDDTPSFDKIVNLKNISRPCLSKSRNQETFMESMDILEPEKPPIIEHVKIDVQMEPIVNIINCKMDIEGPPIKGDKLRNSQFSPPSKEDLVKLINPCNIETKALMSIIYFAKYKSLIKEETSAEIFKTINFKATNFKCLIKEGQDNIKEDMIKDIQHYNATKEDHLLSLMMELILADMGCNLEDIVDIDKQSSESSFSEITSETSDSSNNIQRSFFGKSPYRSTNLDMPDRCSILSSIGLSDEEKSLQSFCEETMEMRLQTAEIKESFQEEEKRVDELMKLTTRLREEMREALYLDDLLHLLKGDLDKVQLKKLPFRIFHKEECSDTDINFII